LNSYFFVSVQAWLVLRVLSASVFVLIFLNVHLPSLSINLGLFQTHIGPYSYILKHTQ